MGEFLTSLAAAVVIPVFTTMAIAGWRLLGKNHWTPDDLLIAFDLLIAAVVMQLSFLGSDVTFAAGPKSSQPAHLAAVIDIRLGLLVALGFVFLPAMAIDLRWRTMHRDLETSDAVRSSLVAAAILMGFFLANFLIYDFVG